MRIVIVGGGVIGLLTAVQCVSTGHEVVLVDQADIPFSGATSFDRHRVVRALHLGNPGGPGVVAAAMRAHRRWIDLERLLSAAFYEQVGALTVLAPGDAPRAMAMLTGAGSPARVLGPADLTASCPRVVFADGASAVVESQAGVLLADRILLACAEWLRRQARAELLGHRRATEVDVAGAAVRLAGGEMLRGDAVLLAAGPWSQALLGRQLAAELVLCRQSMVYCEVPGPDAVAWSATPAMLSLGSDRGAWLVPPVAGTPLKLSAASACRVVTGVEDNTTPRRWRDHLVEAFAAVIPGFHAGWLVDTRDCYYLERAATGGPMLALLGDRVMAYAACGGSSFKFAPLIAGNLSERLTGADPTPTGLDALDSPVVRGSPDTVTSHRQTPAQ